ncbi:MAG: hypothetical protein LBT08_10305, partial [Synergistaceae bacterium]|nr:hypothetical protein [Synergistaceae bacterium]
EEMPDKDGDGWIDAYNGDDGEYLDEHDEEEEANHSYDARVTLDINKEGDVFVIHTVVRLPSEAVEPGQKGVPLATCTFYLDDNTVLGSKIIPYLLVDEDYEIEMKITQSDYPYKDVEELLANLEKEYSQSGQQTGETSGGSGGCSSAATGAALAMSLSAAALIRRKTK